ncbi:TonB-dependent siderophore receptor [Phenylobacterium sp.]|jgi:outer membrane receptor protein involved in Fe transport|uniref:TonB-dependent receptor plug domain-containing protein n=1 Tax=Phenylobacterium sp. TaxID=1871053 RepID=UPI000C8DB54D|nr:TonB-dependent receptor [Phenylobacterium sp.]MAK82804.1 TonB-dependent receptor [Phenylobacterium sp.]|tara:strand:- start:40278 stop:43313 length:3036 start_codon:yes stop_codon:yes gene_type:complete
MNITSCGRRGLLGTTMLCALGAGGAFAQTAETTVDEIIVVGSQVQGSRITDAVPVTVLGQDELQAVAAASGDELFRSIPQMGDVSFNSSYLPNSSNSARGDVGSVNLRNLGVGNTLVLLNGRRVVTHPSSRANENLVPVLTYNTNAIPVNGLQRLEVLRDGAAALYGSDAVAGVVNTVLRTDYDGLTLDAQYGGAEGTGLRQTDLSALFGRNFDRGNVTVFASYTDRTALDAQDQDYTASLDRRPLFAGTRFDGATSLDSRSTVTPWGYFQASAPVRRNGALVTSSAGFFHVQPTTFPGCATPTSGGLCLDDGSISTAGADRDLRFDSPAAYNTTVIPEVERVNLFLTGNYDLTDEITGFGELGYYTATTKSLQTSTGTLSSMPITMPASSYYNPFGPTTFANGTVNPNRLSGIDAPASGRNVTIRTYNFSDAGPNEVDVENSQWRALAGLRGERFGFNWEGAILYSKAEVEDVSDGISATLLQRQLSLSTPEAYNPFNGANLQNTSLADTAPSSQAALDAIRIKTVRRNTSSLALADFKVSRPDFFALPGGDVGMAFGVEYRRETQKDDRDGRVDGTIKFTDAVSGATYTGDLIGTSPSPDTKGSRTVTSAFIEFGVPVISPDMNIPLVQSIEMQLAGRFEDFSDAGSVAKPKVAVAWDVVDGLRLRGSWAQGFKAPNLEQVNATLVTRSNTRTDFIRCEADLRAGRIASFAACSRAGATTAQRAGNQDLKPEESETWGAGVVFEPQFLPPEVGNFIFTVDYWRVKQEGIVGLFGEGNALILDYLLRTQGTSNPDVIRAAPTADDVAAFAGTNLTPVGQVLFVNDQYQNLLPQEARGLDIGVAWSLNGTRFGDFSASFNAAHLLKFYRQPSPAIQALLDAQAAGAINPGVNIAGGGDLIRDEGRPEWKWSASATWRYEQFTLGAFTQYVGDVQDFGLIDAAGDPWIVDSQLTANLYGQYEFTDGMAANTRLRLGVRNLTDEKPPLASDGYLGELYTPYSRYWYVSVRKTF